MHNSHLGTATVLSLWSSCEFDRRLVELNQSVFHWSTTKEYWRPKQTVILRPGREELVSKTIIPTKINKRKQRTEKNTKKWEPCGWMQWYSPVAFNKCIHRDLLYEVDTLVGVAVVIVGRRRVRVGRWPTGRVPNRWVGCWPVVVHRWVGVVVGTQPQWAAQVHHGA